MNAAERLIASPETDLKGRTVKAHIDKWAQYGEKAQQHATAAALILTEVKKELPHGQWMPWLQRYEIAPRTASRLMLEHKSPEKREERREKDRQSKAATRNR